ncbi:hypothetical protein [Microbacterium sp.]|uniref:hypothetical protein n=1 Tax=Microbacterium sp. TaxID=51671 RepID=UPI00260AC4DE|nr:hypothetical protein [Microbacterium sp.]
MFQLRGQIKPPTPRQSLFGSLLGLAFLLLLVGMLQFLQYTRTTETEGMLWWQETREIPAGERAPYLQGAIAFWIFGAIVAVTAIWLMTRRPRQQRDKLKRYLPILKGVESMPVQQIAAITNTNPSTVYRDIQKMIDSGMADDIYLDYQGERVVSKKFVPDRSHKTVVTCPSCNARSEVIVGITRTCAYCNQPLPL